MRRILIAIAVCATLSVKGAAQITVHDPAVTARNAATAVVEEFLVTTEREQRRQLRRMAQRLSLFTDLSKYALPDPPRWRTHDFESAELTTLSRAYHAALNYGDSVGTAYLAASHPVIAAEALLDRLDSSARRVLLARLATLEATDASAVGATHDSGRVRLTGRRELAAIDALEVNVIDPSLEQSATAVLDKISGAALIAGRQRQARVQLLAGVVEQLLIDTKRARDADTVALNMQLTTWRDGHAANAAFVAGTAEALRTWRQP